jgi:predicted nucleic acid-binding protein
VIDLSQASPLIGLSIVGGLPWLQSLFGKVWIPAEVRDEVLSGHVPRGEAEIRSALKSKSLAVWRGSRATTPLPNLDEGESACIRVALARRAPALLLIDERAGRAIAQSRNRARARPGSCRHSSGHWHGQATWLDLLSQSFFRNFARQ